MKYLAIFFFLIFISIKVFAQQKFIEVNVSDTVLVKPDLFVYSIILNDDNDMNYDEDRIKNLKLFDKKQKDEEIKRNRICDSLKTTILKAGFTVLPNSLKNSVTITDNNNKVNTINCLTSTADSVKLLYSMIKNYESVYGFLKIAKAKDETAYYNLLYGKLIAKARQKAKNIAELFNQKIGSIYSVSESNDASQTGGWTAYPPLSSFADAAIPGWHTTLHGDTYFVITNDEKTDTNSYIISQTFNVKFLIE